MAYRVVEVVINAFDLAAQLDSSTRFFTGTTTKTKNLTLSLCEKSLTSAISGWIDANRSDKTITNIVIGLIVPHYTG